MKQTRSLVNAMGIMKGCGVAFFIGLSLFLAQLGTPPPLQAQEVGGVGEVLDLLVEKKLITPADSERVKTAAAKAQADSSAGKIKLSNSITELKLYGDGRFRYQFDEFDQQLNTPENPNSNNVNQRSRWRFRLRLGADIAFGPNHFAGFGLATGRSADSNNQTFTGGFDNYDIFINKLFLGWRAADWLTLIAGKQDNPLYTTDLVWDPDITPQGLVEIVDLGKVLFPDSRLQLQFIAAQNIFFDNNEWNADHDASTDAYQFVEQLKATYNFNKQTSLTVAPGFITYTAADLTGLNNSLAFSKPQDVIRSPSGNIVPSGETRDLQILIAPGDFSFQLGAVKSRFYWDFAYNLAGAKRFNDIYSLTGHTSRDDIAWMIGVQFGTSKRAGDWLLFANYREVGISSIDPNLNDSDFAGGALNVRGIKTGGTYNFTDWLSATLAYYRIWNLQEDLIGGQATGGAGLANVNSFDQIIFDLNWKF